MARSRKSAVRAPLIAFFPTGSMQLRDCSLPAAECKSITMPSMSAAKRALYFFGRLLVRCFYRVTSLGLENIPEGGFLLWPNHITWVDAIVLQLACPRPIRYIIDQEFYCKPTLRPLLRLVGCIPIDARHS